MTGQRQAERFLESDETVDRLIYANKGPNPDLMLVVFIVSLVVVFMLHGGVALYGLVASVWMATIRLRLIVVTHRAVLVIKPPGSDSLSFRSTLLARLPRETRIGPFLPLHGFRSRWGLIVLNGERLFVHKRYRYEVKAADRAITDHAVAAEV